VLVSALVRSVLLYGALALAGVGLIALRVIGLRCGRARSTSPVIPSATARGSRWPAIRHALARWSPLLAVIGGLAGVWFVKTHSTEIVIVTDGAGGAPQAVRDYQIGGTVAYALAPGQHDDHSTLFDRTWVVNRSARAVRVETVQYGGFFPTNDPVAIPPGTAGIFFDIDHIGPTDPPPDHVEDEVNLGIAFREWLTWD